MLYKIRIYDTYETLFTILLKIIYALKIIQTK